MTKIETRKPSLPSPLDLNRIFGGKRRVDLYLQQRICKRIKKARVEAGFTQREMADLLGLTERGYQNYERNRVPFRLLGRISELTGKTQEWLLRGEFQGQQDGDLLGEVSANVAELTQGMAETLRRLERIEALLERPATERKGNSGRDNPRS